MNGTTVIVTGANSGIGLETARALAGKGADVTLAVRDEAKGRAAADDIRKGAPDARLEVAKLDLADLAQVRDFAERFRAAHPRLDVLVNNAGLYTSRQTQTRQGFETTFGVNHLGHFALTNALLPRLGPGARVVTVASEAHRGARVDWTDLDLSRHFSGFRAYANSKLFNIWFARELARRQPSILSVAVHPGSVRTGWARGASAGALGIGVALASPFLISPSKGARTSIYAATAPGVATGGYYRREAPATPSRLARDDAQARRLWEESEALVRR